MPSAVQSARKADNDQKGEPVQVTAAAHSVPGLDKAAREDESAACLGNAGIVLRGTVVAEGQVEDQEDGTYHVTYCTTHAGVYHLHLHAEGGGCSTISAL